MSRAKTRRRREPRLGFSLCGSASLREAPFILVSLIFLFFEQGIRASFFASLSMAAFFASMAAVRRTRVVSLRAERSNLGSWGKGDCFAPLAMT